jgi:iron complex outermembrane receptor protein
LLDGRRLNPIDSSDIAWSVIPMATIERIEIASGGYGVQYGDGATGGVINIITNSQAAQSNAVQISAGSFGTQIANVTMANTFGDTQVLLNAGASRSDGWRENSQAQSQNFSVKAKKNISQLGYFTAEFFSAQEKQGLSGGVTSLVGQADQVAVRFNNVASNVGNQNSGLRLGGFLVLTPATSMDIDVVASVKDSKLLRPYYDTSDSFGPGYVTGPGQVRSSGNVMGFSPKFKTNFDHGINLIYGYDYLKAKQDGASLYGTFAQQVILDNQGRSDFGQRVVLLNLLKLKE